MKSAQSVSQTTRSPRLPILGLLVLALTTFVIVVIDLFPVAVLPAMAVGLHASVPATGALVTAFALTAAVVAVPGAVFLRGLPRRPVLCIALLVLAGACAATGVAPDLAVAIGSRIVAGASVGVVWALLAGCAARMVDDSQQGRAFAVVLSGQTVAFSFGIPAGAALGQVVDWRTMLLVLGVVAAALSLLLRVCVPQVPGERGPLRRPVRAVATDVRVLAVLSVTLCLVTGHHVLYVYVSPFLAHVGISDAALPLLVFGCATVPGVWLAGAMADSRLRLALVVFTAGLSLALAAFAIGPVPSAARLLEAAAWGLFFGGAPTLMQTALVKAAGLPSVDAATALQSTTYNVAIACGSLVGGVTIATGVALLPVVAAVWVMAATACALAFRVGGRPARGRAEAVVAVDAAMCG